MLYLRKGRRRRHLSLVLHSLYIYFVIWTHIYWYSSERHKLCSSNRLWQLHPQCAPRNVAVLQGLWGAVSPLQGSRGNSCFVPVLFLTVWSVRELGIIWNIVVQGLWDSVCLPHIPRGNLLSASVVLLLGVWTELNSVRRLCITHFGVLWEGR